MAFPLDEPLPGPPILGRMAIPAEITKDQLKVLAPLYGHRNAQPADINGTVYERATALFECFAGGLDTEKGLYCGELRFQHIPAPSDGEEPPGTCDFSTILAKPEAATTRRRRNPEPPAPPTPTPIQE